MRIITFLFAFSLLSCTKVKNDTQFEWPKNEITPIFKKFVKAYNTNDLEKLEDFTTKYYEKNYKKNAEYWPSVFADYGQIEAFKISKEWTKKNRLAIWFQGKDTKAWLMIILRMNKDNTKIIGKGVMRGQRPSGNLPPYSSISTDEINPYLKKYLGKLNKRNRFSGSVLVAKGDTILFEETYGKSNKKLNTINNVNTAFNIASTTKTFTAVAIAKLVEQGKLKFTDSISKFIPEYPIDIANQVTIHHLLTHTSGIEIDDYEPFNKDVQRAKNMNDLLQAQLKHIDSMNEGRRKDFKVLNKFDYSNENFALLGLIIERVSKVSYAKYIENNIFKPLEMKNSFSDIHKVMNHKNKATGYSFKNSEGNFINGKRRESKKMIPNLIDPFGGIYTTTKDLYTYFKAIYNHTIVTEETQEILFKTHTDYYGYGFYLSNDAVGHGGVVQGVGSRFEYNKKTGYYVIVLSNYGSMAGNVVADHIEDLLKKNK